MPRSHLRDVLRQFGHRVVELRAAAGLTQEKLAERLGWWPRRVQRVEAGRANVSISGLVEMANALNVEPASLLEATKRTVRRRVGRPRSRR